MTPPVRILAGAFSVASFMWLSYLCEVVWGPAAYWLPTAATLAVCCGMLQIHVEIVAKAAGKKR